MSVCVHFIRMHVYVDKKVVNDFSQITETILIIKIFNYSRNLDLISFCR